jgi:hypothetical protein
LSEELLAPDFKPDPYWWLAAPRPEVDPEEKLPHKVEVTIVGSGFTGLSACVWLIGKLSPENIILDSLVPVVDLPYPSLP